jgi:hypothetical protein
MKKHKHLLIGTAVFLLASISTIGHAIQSPEYASIHGSACQPASLSQSINFNTSWSQRGARNTNDLGSGRNFFVVCPVVMTDDKTALSFSADINMGLRYVDRDGTNSITCTAYRSSYHADAFVKTVTRVDVPGTGSDFSSMGLNSVIDPGDQPFSALSESASVVCALVPQSGIIGISMDFD